MTEMIETHKKQTKSGFIWRLLHNFGSQTVSLAIQIVMARLLLPEYYGIIALTSIFTSLSLVLIQGAFFPSIIQKKEINQLELSSIYFLGIVISVVVSGVVFLISPLMAHFYQTEILSAILRVQSLNIIIGSLFSVHQGLMYRNLEYKKGFISGIIAVIVQGIVGIFLALSAFEVWSIVFAQLAYNVTLGALIIFMIQWKPSFHFSFTALRKMFSYSSPLLVVGLMNAVYVNLTSLFIGKIYDSTTLGYYQRGYTFPTLIMNNFDGAMNHVLFTSLSKIQEQKVERLALLRRSMTLSLFISSPMMLGLVVVAEPLVLVLLTDKWIDAVPFLQLTALGCLIWPLSARMQAINALGRSDITLKLNLLLRILGIIFIVVFSRFNIYLLVISTIISELIIAFVTTFIVKNVMDYRLKDQLKDIVPHLMIGLMMIAIIYPISLISLHPILTLVLQIMAGGMIYILLAWITKSESLSYIIDQLKELKKHFIERRG